jgi:hypothetical protein
MVSTESSSLTGAQTGALEGAERTQSGLLRAQEHLYAALRRPQPTRERQWAQAVATELAAALAALRDHRLEVEEPAGLYAELQRDAPWAVPRIRQLVGQLRRIESDAIDLQIEVARVEAGDFQAVASVRGEAERVLLTLRDLLTKETDLIYERFNEPAALD